MNRSPDDYRKDLPKLTNAGFNTAIHLVRLIDDPGMSIEQLRAHAETARAREFIARTKQWIHEASNLAGIVTDAERAALVDRYGIDLQKAG
jgi:hypothetical protein